MWRRRLLPEGAYRALCRYIGTRRWNYFRDAAWNASVCSDVCSDSSDDRSVVLGFSAEAFFPSEGSETFSLPHAETPVSYTHLDVYKRQVIHTVHPIV